MSNTSKLWTPGFVKICAANLLLFISLYMLLPLFPVYLAERFGISYLTAGLVVALFGVSLFVLGPFYNYLVDTYKRKSICMISLLAIIAVTAGFPLVSGLLWMVVLRILQGIFSGMALMTIGSTLAIDITASSRRSDANTSVARFGRIGMAFGPMIGILVYQFDGYDALFFASALTGVLAMLLVSTVYVAFRAPIGASICSTDRFILPQGWLMAINLILITSVLGILLVTVDSYLFYLSMAMGIIVALVANNFVFAEADVRARIVSGLVLMGAALLLLATHDGNAAFITAALLAGTGLGLASFHFLLMLIKVSEHCQRGTANTTYAFAWEVGVALGVLVGCTFKEEGNSSSVFYIGLWITLLAMALYVGATNAFFLKHRRK